MNNTPQILLKTERFSVHRVSHPGSDGTRHEREIVRHPGSVAILPIVDADHVCLIRNHRVSIDKTLVELPAGTLEAGEEPRIAAFRELTEETGYRAQKMTPLHAFYAAPGILDEFMHLFVAEDLTSGAPQREANEQIENVIVTWQKAFAMVRDREIIDAKTIVGLLLWQAHGNRVSP